MQELFERFAPMMYRRALALLADADEAQDVTHDVFLRLLSRRRFEPHDATHSSFLYRAVTNGCLNRLRDRRRQRASLQRHEGQLARGVAADPERRSLVVDLLQKVNERAAAAACQVHVRELSREEAARELGVCPRTVGNLLSRFRREARAAG